MEADVRPQNDGTMSSQASPPQEAIYHAISKYQFHSDPEYQAGLAAILGHPETPTTDAEIAEKGDLVLQAQCFYFARKHNLFPPIDPSAYAAWLQSSSSSAPEPTPTTPSTLSPTAAPFQPSSATHSTTTQSLAPSQQTQPAPQPPYPTSFAEIVDLITRNIPVPGIEQIPTTVLEPGTSKVDKTPRRRKPWEKDDEDATADQEGNASERSPRTGIVAEAGTTLGSQTTGEGEDGTASIPTATPIRAKMDLNGHRTTGVGVVNILKPNAVPDSGLLAKEL